MYSIKFYANVVRALDEIGAPYMLVGAFAGIPFGVLVQPMILISWLIYGTRILKRFLQDFLYPDIMLIQR